jgi:hypothetical protein
MQPTLTILSGKIKPFLDQGNFRFPPTSVERSSMDKIKTPLLVSNQVKEIACKNSE